jgi:hypothetical protein
LFTYWQSENLVTNQFFSVVPILVLAGCIKYSLYVCPHESGGVMNFAEFMNDDEIDDLYRPGSSI